MIPPNYPPLIPVGYHTIPEVLKIAGSRGDEVFSRLKEALLDGSVRAYVRSDGETLRISQEDLQDLSFGWDDWLDGGVIPLAPSLAQTPEWKAWDPFSSPLHR